MTTQINTIPASYLVNDYPVIIGAGGAGIALIELMLTNSTRVPIGNVLSFPSPASVQSYFGATSNEAAEAAVYFAGFNNSTQKPGALLFTQYPTAAVSGYLRGGSVSTMTLAQLQGLSGSLSVTIGGTVETAASVSLSSATSFSNAAQLLTTGFSQAGPVQGVVTANIGAAFTATATGTSLAVSAVTGLISVGDTLTGTGITTGTTIVAQVSGVPGGAGVYTISVSSTAAAASVTSTSIYMVVSAITSGFVGNSQVASGASITSSPYVTGQLSGTPGGAGLYTLSSAEEVVSEAVTLTLPFVTYDAVSGAFVITSSTAGTVATISYATGTLSGALALTQATGAVTSQGAAAATPAAFMNAVIAQTSNWVSFQTLFDPDAGSGNAQKLLFAEWTSLQTGNFLYLATDTDITPTESTQATSSLGYLCTANNYTGTVPIYQPAGQSLHHAAFVGGSIASINTNATNGRITLAGKGQSGLGASVTTQTVAANLAANGYNFLGAFSTVSTSYNLFENGSVSGQFAWIDSQVNFVWMKSLAVDALMQLLTTENSIPQNATGAGMIRSALQGVANQALNFGAIVAGVALSPAQANEVNTLAGYAVDGTITRFGYAIVIQAASATTRAARGSPTIYLFYADGESVQHINLSSVIVQ